MRTLYIRLPTDAQPRARPLPAHTGQQPTTPAAASKVAAAAPVPAAEALPRWYSYSPGALLQTESSGRRLSDPGELPGPHGGKMVHIQPRGRHSFTAEVALPQVGYCNLLFSVLWQTSQVSQVSLLHMDHMPMKLGTMNYVCNCIGICLYACIRVHVTCFL